MLFLHRAASNQIEYALAWQLEQREVGLGNHVCNQHNGGELQYDSSMAACEISTMMKGQARCMERHVVPRSDEATARHLESR